MLSMLMYRFSGGHGQDHLAEVDETQDGGWSERVQCGRCGAGNGNADSLHLLAALQATICAKTIAIDLPWKQVDVDLGHFTAGRGNTREEADSATIWHGILTYFNLVTFVFQLPSTFVQYVPSRHRETLQGALLCFSSQSMQEHQFAALRSCNPGSLSLNFWQA